MQKDFLSGTARLEELGNEYKRLTKDSYKSASLENWFNEFYVLYGPNNKSRTILDIWLGVTKNAGYIAEAIRKNNPGEILEGVSHVFSWLCSIISRCFYEYNDPSISSKWQFDKSVEDIIFGKYPRHCPLCLQEKCHCPIEKKRYEEINSTTRKEIWQRNKEKLKRFSDICKPNTLTEWGNMFDEIYGQANYGANLDSICFHLFEEIGEAAGAIFKIDRLNPKSVEQSEKQAIYNEFADIFSWLFGLSNKVNQMFYEIEKFVAKYPSEGTSKTVLPIPISIDEILWQSYTRKGEECMTCPHCDRNVCKCGDKQLKELK